MVASYKYFYVIAETAEKRKIIQQVESELEASGFRFVEKTEEGVWVEASKAKAHGKLVQALREKAPELRRRMMEELQMDNHDLNPDADAVDNIVEEFDEGFWRLDNFDLNLDADCGDEFLDFLDNFDLNLDADCGDEFLDFMINL